MDSLNWFRTDLTREQAEIELENKPEGTYLVRSSVHAGSKYVLSVVAPQQTVHIVIDENQGKYFIKSNYQQRRRLAKNDASVESGSRSRSPSHHKLMSASSLTNTSNVSSSTISSSSNNSLNDDITQFNNNNKDSFAANKFATLTDLIVYYSKNILQINHKSWNVVLKLPAFLNQSTKF